MRFTRKKNTPFICQNVDKMPLSSIANNKSFMSDNDYNCMSFGKIISISCRCARVWKKIVDSRKQTWRRTKIKKKLKLLFTHVSNAHTFCIQWMRKNICFVLLWIRLHALLSKAIIKSAMIKKKQQNSKQIRF